MKKELKSLFDLYEQDVEEQEEQEEYVEEVTEEEQEEIDSYMDEELDNHIKEKEKKDKKLRKANQKILEKEINTVDLDEYEIEDDFKEEKGKKHISVRKVLNAIICILFILVILSVIDIVCVTKYEKGPFFAIPMYTYEDGGTKEYYGIGYKVIKYNQLQGRRDMEIGTWSLKYNVDPIYIDIIDLAIEFNNDEQEAYDRYYKQLLIINGSLKEVDKDNNKIVLSYEDEGEKYSIDVVCNMETDQENLSILEPKYEISAMGTMIKYEAKTANKRPTIYLDNCFAEQ